MLISKAKMEVMRDVLAKTEPKPKILLEFGAYVGNSAVGWGAIMRELHGSNLEGVHAYAFELDPQIAECARAMVKFAGVDDIVTIIQGTASDSIKKLLAEGKIQPGNVDVAFIDHWEKYYVPDLQLCEELKILHLNSVVLADNTDYPGAPTYLKYVKAGGSGVPGAVRYESESVTVTKEKNPVSQILPFLLISPAVNTSYPHPENLLADVLPCISCRQLLR